MMGGVEDVLSCSESVTKQKKDTSEGAKKMPWQRTLVGVAGVAWGVTKVSEPVAAIAE